MNPTRISNLHIPVGHLSTGNHNRITDVPDVRVGHGTILPAEGSLCTRAGEDLNDNKWMMAFTAAANCVESSIRKPMSAARIVIGFNRAVTVRIPRELLPEARKGARASAGSAP